MTRRLAIGIDIGGTKVAGGVVAPDGTIQATARRATPGASVSATEDAIAAVVEELAAGIWHFDPHLRSSRAGADLRIDIADPAPQRDVWTGRRCDRDFTANANSGGILFVQIRHDPDR